MKYLLTLVEQGIVSPHAIAPSQETQSPQDRTRPAARSTRAKLIEAARKLFSEYGYEGVSVTDIGKKAGVSHAMIYANFTDKAGLLYEIVRENNAPQLPAVRKAAKSSGHALWTAS